MCLSQCNLRVKVCSIPAECLQMGWFLVVHLLMVQPTLGSPLTRFEVHIASRNLWGVVSKLDPKFYVRLVIISAMKLKCWGEIKHTFGMILHFSHKPTWVIKKNEIDWIVKSQQTNQTSSVFSSWLTWNIIDPRWFWNQNTGAAPSSSSAAQPQDDSGRRTPAEMGNYIGPVLCQDKLFWENVYVCVPMYVYACVNTWIYIYIYITRMYL